MRAGGHIYVPIDHKERRKCDQHKCLIEQVTRVGNESG